MYHAIVEKICGCLVVMFSRLLFVFFPAHQVKFDLYMYSKKNCHTITKTRKKYDFLTFKKGCTCGPRAGFVVYGFLIEVVCLFIDLIWYVDSFG